MTEVWLEIQRASGIGVDVRKIKTTDGAPFAVADGACPECAATPFQVQGQGASRHGSDDTLRANGVARCCGARVGYIFAKPDTIFGLEEDERVLHGRARVY